MKYCEPRLCSINPLVGYFVLAFAWTWSCWWSVVAARRGSISLPIAEDRLATLGQFGPFAAALVVAALTDGRGGLRDLLRRLFRWRAKPVWLIVALVLLPSTMLVAIYWHAYLRGTIGDLRFRGDVATLPMQFVYLLVLGGPLGEEPGWRGFALPRLQSSCGPIVGSIVLGVLHALWHLPLWWMYPPPCPFGMYMIGVVLTTFLFTWLFNHTYGSVLYSLVFHTSLSIASMRLPDVPAYHWWIVVLTAVVLVVISSDRQLGLQWRQST